jgi:type IV pilus assembly protein PilB
MLAELTEDDIVDMNNAGLSDKDLNDMASNAPIVKFVELVLNQAIKDKASDIHFEPFKDKFRIRYRIDGALYEMPPPPIHLALPVISRIKVLSGLNIAERRLPQDGRIELRVGGKPIDMRVSTLPTMYGESVVLRILDRSSVKLDLDTLGLEPKLLSDLRELIKNPNGIIAVTGPTGSGKTTTLYGCLNEINTIEDKILTAEDPVEYDIDGIMQVPVKESVGMTFAKALKAFLRQDPDRIMVGEIRDLETASISIQAALTGHLVFSTLHTNDSAGTITRLTDMGIEPFLITSSLIAILAQRLVRKICPHCKSTYKPTEKDLRMLGINRNYIGDNVFYYGKGCETCNGSGYKGRRGLYELLVMSDPIRDLIYERSPTAVLASKARAEGMKTLREDGVQAILQGDTTIEEVLKYT